MRWRFGITVLVRALHAILLIAYGLTIITLVLVGTAGFSACQDAAWLFGLGALLYICLYSMPISRWIYQGLDQVITGWPETASFSPT